MNTAATASSARQVLNTLSLMDDPRWLVADVVYCTRIRLAGNGLFYS